MTFPATPSEIRKTRASSSGLDPFRFAPRQAARLVARLMLLAAALLFSLAPLRAQALQQTVNVGGFPFSFAVDPVYNQIYVANASGGLSVIDGTTANVTLTIPGDPTETAYAVGIDTGGLSHIVYVVDHANNKVNTFLAGASNVGTSFINSIPTGSLPWAIAVDPVLHKAYVTNVGDGTVTIISGTSQTTATATVGANPEAIAVNPETHQVFVANRSISSTDGTVSVINGNTNAIVANTPLAVGSQPISVAINASTNMIYVACVSTPDSEVVQIVGSSVGSVGYVPTALNSSGGSPVSIAINPITDQVYAQNVETSVAIYNFESSANPTPTIVTSVGSEANYIAVDVVTNIAYVTNGTDGVSIVNGNSLTATPLSVPGTLQAVAVNPVTHRAYVASYVSSGTVSIIDGDTNSVALFGFDNSAPAYLAIDPVKNMLYVASAIGEVDAVNLSTNNQSYTHTVPTSPTALLVDPIQQLVYELDANAGLAILTPGGSSFAVADVSGSGTGFSALTENPVTGTVFFASNDGVINYFNQPASQGGNLNGFVPNPTGLVANPATGQVYGVSSTSIYQLDPASNTISHNALPEGAVGVVINPATNTLYASTASGDILVINGATLASATVLNPGFPAASGGIAINPVTNQIYILSSNPTSPTLTQMDGTSHIITSITLPAVGLALAINPTTNKIYVTASGDNIYVVDGLSQQVLATVNGTQTNPLAVAVNPATNSAYIYNSGSEYVGSAIYEFQTAGVGSAANANGVSGSNSLTTVIEPFPSNTTATEEPEFTFHASSSLISNPAPDAVLYQVDTWQGQWLETTFQEGTEWAITLSQPLTPGFHTIYAYATTGEDATSTDSGYQTSPVIGAITSYGFLVAPPLGVLTPGSGLSFGVAEYGSEVGPLTFTLSNEGVGPLVFSDTVVFGGTNQGDFPETAGGTCVEDTGGLTAGTSCTLVLDFMPTGFGTENATATVSTSNSGGIVSNLQPIPLTGISYPYLTLDVSGSGSGTVTDTANGISCQQGLECFYDFPVGTQINLTANPGAGYVLDGFSSPCTPSSTTCSFTVTGNNLIAAHFSPASATTYSLTVTELGTGAGTISDGLSSPQQMTCVTAPSPNPVTTCSATINSGQSFTLTATATGSSTFGGWSPNSNYSACTSAGTSSTCTINGMSSNMTAAAFFVPPPASVTLTYNPVAPSNTAYFNCIPTDPSLPPSPTNPCTNPNAHQVNLGVPAVSTQFNLVVLATEVSPLQADGICETGNTVLNDFDCRFVSFFSGPTVATGVEVPQCDAYANGDCIFYSVYYSTDGVTRTEPDPSWYTPPVTWNIAFNDDNNAAPVGYSSSERLYDDPDYEPSPTTPYGTNCAAFMVTGTLPGSPTTISCQFEFDITTYFNPTEVVDRGIGGVTQQFNDVVVAFPLATPSTPPPSLSVSDTPDPSEAPAVAGVSGGVQALITNGLTIGYTATITNTAAPGSGSANNVVLTDTLPNSTGLSWTIASVNPAQVQINGTLTNTCSISSSSPQQLTCNFGSISPVVSAIVDVVSPSVAGTFSNSVTVTASNNPTITATSSPITVSTTAFSGLTSSSTITYGAASVPLSGVIGSGSLHPPTTESVTVTIDGITTTTAIGSGGVFSVPAFVTSAIPASATPYTITYSYAGDSDFTPATNTSTTLTVKQATATFSSVTASQSITAGTASIPLAGTISSGSLHPPAGETVKVTIDGISQSTTTGTGGTFTLNFTTSAIPASATPYTITYSYAGDANFTTATNTSTTLTVNSATGTTTFSSVTASQSITYGTASIALGGTLTSGTKHPPAGETVKVTIDGITQSTTTKTGGTFTLTFTTSAIAVSATPYTITYSYAGDSNFGPATNTATTLTVNKGTTTFSAVTASQSITVGATSIALSGTLSSGSLHPPAGESVTVTIDSLTQSTITTGTGGTFTLTFTTSAIPASATPYTITYSYAGDTNFSSATNTSTTLTVNSAVGTGLTISPTSLAFGNVYLGTIPVKMVTLTNNTSSTVTISSVSLTAVPGGDSYDFVGLNLCSKSLAVKKSCQVEMSFIPNSAVNIVQSAILTIVDSASSKAQTVTMTATVIDPLATPNPSSLSFGTVKTGTTSATKMVTVTNTGLTTTTISAVAISGNFALTSATTCKAATTLTAGGKCTLVVTFTPAAKGQRSGQITLTDNALNSPQTIGLSGTGD
jgi:YVTN family beta-propeller protein